MGLADESHGEFRQDWERRSLIIHATYQFHALTHEILSYAQEITLSDDQFSSERAIHDPFSYFMFEAANLELLELSARGSWA